MSYFIMYILVIIDSFKGFLNMAAGCSLAAFIITVLVSVFYYLESNCSDSSWDSILKHSKKIIGVLFLSGFFALTNSLIPTTKQLAAIYLIPQMVNNEQVRTIGKNSLSILEKYSQQYLEDLAKKVEPQKEATK